MKALADQVALVTGGGRGIGRGISLELAKAGATVAINYHRDKTAAEEVAAEIEKGGGKALLVGGDVADFGAVEKMVADTVAKFGKLTIAVANAAYSDREPFYEADLAGFRRTVDVCLWGSFNLLRTATNQMMAAGKGGSIVLVSSPQARIAAPRSMAYNMSKAAINQMARTAAIEVVEHRIRVNIMTPGWIDTPGERKFASEEVIQAAGAKLPWKRLGRPDEIGRGVVFLCDPQNEYVTGSDLLIDGGVSLPWWASRGSAAPAG
ncbi:MAG TPA: SDR family oxidoreductase [Pirellulales bacterium]|nr:SDR family oxidoreductase [Pirellulales bacterium]